jgi:UDP-N-acetylglucosamine 1-carboxyvinyltransferase
MQFVIDGGRALRGEVDIGGAKNAALPIIAATLLTADECLLENVPDIEDVRVLIGVLAEMGVQVRSLDDNRVLVQSSSLNSPQVPVSLATRLRGSFLVAGPILARFGEVSIPHPGGCDIGTRPVSVDLKGFRTMGAECETTNGLYCIRTGRLEGRRISLDYPSHTGTENLLMASCLADGVTIIENASVEPEVMDLACCLSAMGARIHGAGTGIIRVDGVSRLHGVAYRVMPDRLEAGTFALAAAVTGGSVSFGGAISSYVGAITAKLGEAGVAVTARDDRYTVAAGPRVLPVDVRTYPYPGFPTDLQAPFAVLMTQADGESTIHETMYDGRLKYAAQLRRMGANIEVEGRTALVRGPARLNGASVRALDIRSGAALMLAGLAAEGRSTVDHTELIDRGYEKVDAKLRSLGAEIRRTESTTSAENAPSLAYSAGPSEPENPPLSP